MFDSVKKIVMPVRKSDDDLFAEAEAIVSQALSGLFEAAGGPQVGRRSRAGLTITAVRLELSPDAA